MLCDLCKDKEANVFFTQIVSGQVQKVNLCEECSKQKGVSDPTGFALAELLLGMGPQEETSDAKATETVCPGCGFSQSEFKRIGRLGCPHCYDVFVPEIEGVLTNLHKGTRHTGKIPGRAAARAVSSRLDSLRNALAKAIDEENFEDAVRLRDEINHLAPRRRPRRSALLPDPATPMMRFSTLIRQPAAWMLPEGPHADIVISTRIRLARNLASRPFPGWAKKEERIAALSEIQPNVEGLPGMLDGFSSDLTKLDQKQKQVLVERHLISREHAAKGPGSAAVINRAQNLSVMINEEDHLRMQAILPGLDLEKAHALVDRADTDLEQRLPFAFHADYGYLTACPTNLGTGLRASAMMHLPGLVLGDQINQVIHSANRIGLAVRGIYGEGTEALAHLFQVSNQNTLGEREKEIISRLEKVIEQIIQKERHARRKLLETSAARLRDHIGRAYGVLRYAFSIETKEALNHLSMLRLGQDLSLLNPGNQLLIDHLLVEIQPAHLQLSEKQTTLSAEERDRTRAALLRLHLRNLPEPEIPAPDTPADSSE